MEIYQVMEDEAYLPAGTLVRLSDAQVSTRQSQVRPLADSWFIVLTPLYFQQGDVITLMTPLEEARMAPFIPPELRKPVIGHPNHRLRRTKEHA